MSQDEILSKSLEYLKSAPDADLIVIVGPTATGKTDLALSLATELRLEIINADSRVVYREMNIGTAKPSIDELLRVKHHLVDIRDPNESYSAGDFRKDFDLIFSSLGSRKSPKAIVVGGTGLYLRAALDDLELLELEPGPELRQEIRELFKAGGLEAIQKELLSLDSDAANFIDIKNPIRIMRAIEMLKLSGEPLSKLRRKSEEKRYKTLYLGLNYENRERLYSIINSRVDVMIASGLIAETETLINKYGVTDVLRSTIGYSEILEYLSRRLSLDEAIALIKQHTRNYAKRQLTWFRANSAINWIYR